LDMDWIHPWIGSIHGLDWIGFDWIGLGLNWVRISANFTDWIVLG